MKVKNDTIIIIISTSNNMVLCHIHPIELWHSRLSNDIIIYYDFNNYTKIYSINFEHIILLWPEKNQYCYVFYVLHNIVI